MERDEDDVPPPKIAPPVFLSVPPPPPLPPPQVQSSHHLASGGGASKPSRPSRSQQVWLLTHFFLFPFCEISLICLEGKSMTPSRGNTILFHSSQQLPRLRLGPSKGFFELTWRPTRSLDSPCALLPELQRYKDTVRCGAPGAKVSGHRQQQLTQTLIVRLLKTHFFYIDP